MNRERVILASVGKKERIEELDIIRGVALLGILLANMSLFSYPYAYYEMLNFSLWNDVWNRSVVWLIHIFVEYKFITIFSFLFGLGFTIFIQRSLDKSGKPGRLFVRRMLFLLVLGLIHGYFIWFGDILLIYGVLGLFLLLFRNASPKTLLILGLGTLLLMTTLMAVQTFIFDNEMSNLAPPSEQIKQTAEQSLHNYSNGSFIDIFNQRITDGNLLHFGMFYSFFLSLGMFFIGAFAGKKRYFQKLNENRNIIKRVWIGSLFIGIPFLVLQIILKLTIDQANNGFNFAQVTGILVSGPAIALFYISSLLILLRTKRGKKVLAPFASVGRMALTNYLLQSIICTTLFYSYGLGWYGAVGPLLGSVLAFCIFGFQIFLSNKWLAHFEYGPMEWLWRWITYLKRPVFKKKKEEIDVNYFSN
ncbi:DUF418 domain-containing protein [Bacillus horti]|uniref:DUF418 domain-containing protein n=1 Tax=Caldalkalibacillus horti TaxID=77523 RepID=A0ABT9W0A4_9BACI|nr:DUF418 domain-containing protein [Bacillus horti]MDQ0166534.1 uncharacterized protein [Bacillus horti]